MTTTLGEAAIRHASGAERNREAGLRMTSTWRARRFSVDDATPVCDWVQSRRLLQLVSSDDAERLSPAILTRWVDHAIDTVVIVDEATDEPAGFCTLSTSEVPAAPPQFVELCHLIVNPLYRYLFIGPRICKAAKGVARQLGFSHLHGRVVPQHRYGIALAKHEQFIELVTPPHYLPAGFRWFRHVMPILEH